MADGGIMIATQGAMFDHDGRRVFLIGGKTTVREGHPILKGRENLFKPLVPDFEVEDPPAKQAPRSRKPPARDGEQQ